MPVTPFAKDNVIPVALGPLENRSLRVAAAASQKTKTSDACAASKDHSDRDWLGEILI